MSNGATVTPSPTTANLRLGLAQVNPTVGDLAGNAKLVREHTRRAAAAGADLLVFPEMVLTGYPIEDLALRESFQRASHAALSALAGDLAADGSGQVATIVGFLDAPGDTSRTLGQPVGRPRNAAAVLYGGDVVAVYAKHHLPNYGVFDEYRYFVPGQESVVIRIRGIDVALAICEDLWRAGGPVAEVREAGAGLLVVLNGSPYERSKDDARLALVQQRAREANCPLAYVNLVGGQDDLVFDGDSMVVDATGSVLARAGEFVEAHVVLDVALQLGDPSCPPAHVLRPAGPAPAKPALPPVAIESNLPERAEVYAALVVGLRDYVVKNGFSTVALGLSGGIDSALVAAIACDAVGSANVIGVAMPSRYSSAHSLTDAADLATRTGLRFRTVSIEPMVATFIEALGLTGVSQENVQARVRGVILMGISNAEGPLVLATGNKSEIAVGYSTIYGDAVGGFAPIKDVPKSMVWALARWRNDEALTRGETPPIPVNSIVKEPSAELRPDQLDSDSLPDYPVLDALLDAYVEQDVGAAGLVAKGFDPALVQRVLRMIDAAEYKRRQYPPGTKITFRAFGRDRRLPVTNRWTETTL